MSAESGTNMTKGSLRNTVLKQLADTKGGADLKLYLCSHQTGDRIVLLRVLSILAVMLSGLLS